MVHKLRKEQVPLNSLLIRLKPQDKTDHSNIYLQNIPHYVFSLSQQPGTWKKPLTSSYEQNTRKK